MCSSVPYADGAPSQNFYFLVFEGPWVCHRCSDLKHDLRKGWVCLQPQPQEHKLSPCCVSFIKCLTSYLPFDNDHSHPVQRKMQAASSGFLEMMYPGKNFLFSHHNLPSYLFEEQHLFSRCVFMSGFLYKCLCVYFVPVTTHIHKVIFSQNERNSNMWERKDLHLRFQWKPSSAF